MKTTVSFFALMFYVCYIASSQTVILFLLATITCNSQGWRKLYLPEVDSTARIIQFVDSLNGWVIAEDKIFYTNNGGVNWDIYYYPDKEQYEYVTFNSNLTGLLISASSVQMYDPKIYRSTDAGKNWQLQNQFINRFSIKSLRNSAKEKSIQFLTSTQIAFLGLDYVNRYYHFWMLEFQSPTLDSIKLPYGYPFPVGIWAYNDIGFRDRSSGYITAGQSLTPGSLPWGLILKTTDIGQTWQDDTVMYQAMYDRIEFTDSKRGYISGRSNYSYDEIQSRWSSIPIIRYTTDAGNTWKNVIHSHVLRGYFKNDSTFLCIPYLSEQKHSNGYLAETNVRIPLSSTKLLDDSLLVDFSFVSSDNIWALRADGRTVYKWDPLLSANETIDIPLKLHLSQNYPNPVIDNTRIDFTLPREGIVQSSIYDLLGRKVKSIAYGFFEKGIHSINVRCADLPNGTYMYDLQLLNKNQITSRIVKKMIVFKP